MVRRRRRGSGRCTTTERDGGRVRERERGERDQSSRVDPFRARLSRASRRRASFDVHEARHRFARARRGDASIARLRRSLARARRGDAKERRARRAFVFFELARDADGIGARE